jgi:hypothetical protein
MANRNEGEGSRSAARRYNDGATKTARKKKMRNAAPRSDRERAEMEEAEEKRRARAKALDPTAERDYSHPAKGRDQRTCTRLASEPTNGYHNPPSATVIASPFTPSAASLQRNAITCATSRGSRTRFRG